MPTARPAAYDDQASHQIQPVRLPVLGNRPLTKSTSESMMVGHRVEEGRGIVGGRLGGVGVQPVEVRPGLLNSTTSPSRANSSVSARSWSSRLLITCRENTSGVVQGAEAPVRE
ncbi:hypothetical protein [Planosporangium mesophilum]|uniref:hypothetical protein n=1 Tax=Planosporangium mesophilum TaxID=689768 RepID=UPI001439031E|nr:hypothetical protein [Planosporangium mesophilum]NJC85309.1 hypothetical protein [Planosporangium mesophilum]